MNKAALVQFYQHNQKYFDAAENGTESGNLFAPHTRVLSYIKGLSGKRVCDFGCGGGANIRAMFNEKNQYLGVDISEDAVRDAQRRLLRQNVQYVKISGDYPLPVRPGTFDIITSFFTFEHLLEPGAALDDFKRLLAIGGELFLICPNYGSPLKSAPPLGNPSKVKTVRKSIGVLHMMLRRLFHPDASLAITMIPLDRLDLSDTWGPDMDATNEPWSWEIAAYLKSLGFKISEVNTWEGELKTSPERALKPFRFLPVIKHFGALCSIHATRIS